MIIKSRNFDALMKQSVEQIIILCEYFEKQLAKIEKISSYFKIEMKFYIR